MEYLFLEVSKILIYLFKFWNIIALSIGRTITQFYLSLVKWLL